MICKKYLFLLFIIPCFIHGQLDINKNIVGPSVGFSFLGSTLQFGLNHEYTFGINQLGLGKEGIVGIGFTFRYWEYSENFKDFKWDYKDILFGIQTNYHFYMSNDNIDPWFGIVLAYDFGDADVKITNMDIDLLKNDYAGFFIGANAGVRYWITNNMAISTRLGIGTSSYGALELGFDYKFN